MRAVVEICILAGGLSTRMGRPKARLRLGNLTLLGHVRKNVAELNLPVRIIRKDLVPRCGPLGGIYSALKTTTAEAVLFLPCDTPFLSGALLRRFLAEFDGRRPLFGAARERVGFPILLPRSGLPVLAEQINERKFALHDLAPATNARLLRVPTRQLFNINAPAALAEARKRWRSAQEQLVKRR